MASTNKTTHYELSQYVGTDKPTYLTDYNNDMSNIDTGIYNAQTKADSAYSLADTADGKADNATLTANSALTNAGTANTNIGTMANLTTTEKSNLVGAVNEVNYNLSLFNLTSYNSLTITADNGSVSGTLYIAKNGNGSLFKIYGKLDLDNTSADTITLTTSDTGLRPSASYTIDCLGTRELFTGSAGFPTALSGFAPINVQVNTNGTLTIPVSSANGVYTKARVIIHPSLLFNSDFGDSPIPD